MLSHVRIKADLFKKHGNPDEPEELQKLYAAIDVNQRPDAANASDARPSRTPFLSFQVAESGSENEMEEPIGEAPQCVYKQLIADR